MFNQVVQCNFLQVTEPHKIHKTNAIWYLGIPCVAVIPQVKALVRHLELTFCSTAHSWMIKEPQIFNYFLTLIKTIMFCGDLSRGERTEEVFQIHFSICQVGEIRKHKAAPPPEKVQENSCCLVMPPWWVNSRYEKCFWNLWALRLCR